MLIYNNTDNKILDTLSHVRVSDTTKHKCELRIEIDLLELLTNQSTDYRRKTPSTN